MVTLINVYAALAAVLLACKKEHLMKVKTVHKKLVYYAEVRHSALLPEARSPR